MYRLKAHRLATPERVAQSAAQTSYWYHSFFFDNGASIRGIYDVGSNVADYKFPALSGKRVLDVGPGSGWFTAYFEENGAQVVAAEAPTSLDLDIFGNWSAPSAAPVAGNLFSENFERFGPMGPSFEIVHSLLQLRTQLVKARVYELDQALSHEEPFDLIFAGSILMHLRDPIGALAVLRRICRGTLVANSYFHEGLDKLAGPMMMMTRWSPILWWLPNQDCLRQWFLGAGFQNVEIMGEVELNVDRPYIDGRGIAHGQSQSLRLVHASV